MSRSSKNESLDTGPGATVTTRAVVAVLGVVAADNDFGNGDGMVNVELDDATDDDGDDNIDDDDVR